MSSTFILRIIRLFVILSFQVLVFNHIHLFGYITPLVIGYMMVCFHQGTSRMELLLWGFTTGLLFDIFSNTAGMASAACTLVAMTQPKLLSMFTPRDASDTIIPTFKTLGFWNYILYTTLLMSILHGTFYLLDAFTLVDWQLTLLSIIGGTIAATIIIFFIELLVRPRMTPPHNL